MSTLFDVTSMHLDKGTIAGQAWGKVLDSFQVPENIGSSRILDGKPGFIECTVFG
jgi:hypothetical protein